MSSIVPCAPSNSTGLLAFIASRNRNDVSRTIGRIRSAKPSYCVRSASVSRSHGMPNASAMVFLSSTITANSLRKLSVSSRSAMRMPRRLILSSYAGPMPRDVVPIAVRSFRASLIFSTMRCIGKITCARLEIANCFSTAMPSLSSIAISSSSAAGSITTPLPITACTPGRRIPLGISFSTYFCAPT